MDEINAKIKSFLEQKGELDYWVAVELYTLHPQNRKNVVITLNQRWSKSAMHSKIIYELEKLVGNDFTNRSTKLKERPAVLPFKLISETKKEAPEDYEYKIKYNDLPKELQEIVIEKGQVYNALEQSKLKLAQIGEMNDDKSVSKRSLILKDMRRMSDRIKKIHSLLITFQENNAFAYDDELEAEEANEIAGKAKDFFKDVEALKNTPVGKSLQKDLPIEKAEKKSTEEILDDNFKYKSMGYWKLKDLQVKLRSTINKQLQRAKDTDKESIKTKNLEKAELGKLMLEWLADYFENNEEPEK